MILNKKILIVGGSGSLGNQLIKTYLDKNEIINYSRDENKHWSMELQYQSPNLKNVIGDIRDRTKIRQTLLRHKPNIIIIAAALKHIDRCEYEINESLNTNIIGIQNILDTIETNLDQLTSLETVCFISTDKACSPVNVYGMCKSICEGLIVEKAKYIPHIKFVCVRYGNVLNSRGSIIPILENKCQDPNYKELTLTSPLMTRFIMTLEESVQLIEYAILEGESGDICIPKLKAMKIEDLFALFSEKYNKSVRISGLRSGEKIHESLINDTQSLRTVDKGLHYHITASFRNICDENNIYHYHSGLEQVSKEELLGYLSSIRFFMIPHAADNLSHMCQSIERLNPEKYQNTEPFPYGMVERIFLPDVAYRAQQEILEAPLDCWDRYDNMFEQKWTYRDKTQMPETLTSIFQDLTHPQWLATLSHLTGIPLELDGYRHYWGIHTYDNGDFLKIHVDAGLHPKNDMKKALTFGVYLSSCWKPEFGCDLEIWDGEGAENDQAVLHRKVDSISPMFNRAIFFTNTDKSWHGNPTPSVGSSQAKRIFLTISYLTKNDPQYKNHRTRAFFRPLPIDNEEDAKKMREFSLERASESGVQSAYRSR
jgi:UDP-glucose 4-epimerase